MYKRQVSGFQMMTEKELRFEGAYYIDATGDGSLGAMAGLPYRMGKESRDTYGCLLYTSSHGMGRLRLAG